MATVRRSGHLRGGIGLAAQRIGHGPEVLVTTTSDHVALRSPTRPDHFSGQALHLFTAPTRLAPWVRRVATTVAAIPGVTSGQVCWEVDTTDVAVARDSVPVDIPATAEVSLVSVMEWRPGLDRDDPQVRHRAVDELDVRAPTSLDIRSGRDEHVMAGARALYLQAGWGGDGDYWRWYVAQQLDLMVVRRCEVWVAYAMGIPASRASVMHDRAGLAIVEDVITHPLHRGKGLAAALVVHALTAHLGQHPGDRIVIRAAADGSSQGLYERLGFMPVATDVCVRVDVPAT